MIHISFRTQKILGRLSHSMWFRDVFLEMQVRPMKLEAAGEDSQEIVEPEELEALMLLCGGAYSADA